MLRWSPRNAITMNRQPQDLVKIFESPSGKKLCLLFVGILSWSMTTLWLPFSNYDQILIEGDYAKFYWFTLKQTQWFLDHGSPFGVAPFIHGGMPGFLFLRTGFVFYLPFYLFFGPTLGFSLLLVVATVLFSIGAFLLLDELQLSRWIALSFALMTALGLGLTDYINVGMVPYVIALSANMWLLYFLVLFYRGDKRALFPATFLAAALMYTHVASLVGILVPAGLVLIYHLHKEGRWRDAQTPILQASLCFLLMSVPWIFNFLALADTINNDYLFTSEQPDTFAQLVWAHAVQLTGHRAEVPATLTDTLSLWGSFALSGATFYLVLLPLGLLALTHVINRHEPEPPNLGLLLALGVFSWCGVALGFVPGLRILFQRVVSWLPVVSGLLYLCAFYFALERTQEKVRYVLLPVGSLLCLVGLVLVRPPSTTELFTLNSPKEIDPKMVQWIDSQDVLLMENCSHVNPSQGMGAFETCGAQHHWTGMLSDLLGVPIFAHAGDDPHPFMIYRDHYLNSSTFNGEVLSESNMAAFESRLTQSRVTKACVFSERARIYFFSHAQWQPLGQTPLYHCYGHTASAQGHWKIDAVSPFEMHLTYQGEGATKQLPFLYYPLWQAQSATGASIPLTACEDSLCLDTNRVPNQIHLNWPKQLPYSLLALLGLLLSLIFVWRYRL